MGTTRSNFKWPNLCKVKICTGEILARGLCGAHYRRLSKTGSTKSRAPIKRRVFGKTIINTPEYIAWRSMKQRCNNPKDKFYSYYGGRGIKVCKRWDKSDNFLADMGKRPSPKHSLDRINNDRGYSPSNCRWATKSQQMKNRRSFKRGTQNV